MPLFQEELELEEVLSQTYYLGWKLGDQLFLICLFLELTQADLQATATTSKHLIEGAKGNKET